MQAPCFTLWRKLEGRHEEVSRRDQTFFVNQFPLCESSPRTLPNSRISAPKHTGLAAPACGVKDGVDDHSVHVRVCLVADGHVRGRFYRDGGGHTKQQGENAADMVIV